MCEQASSDSTQSRSHQCSTSCHTWSRAAGFWYCYTSRRWPMPKSRCSRCSDTSQALGTPSPALRRTVSFHTVSGSFWRPSSSCVTQQRQLRAANKRHQQHWLIRTHVTYILTGVSLATRIKTSPSTCYSLWPFDDSQVSVCGQVDAQTLLWNPPRCVYTWQNNSFWLHVYCVLYCRQSCIL